MNGENRNELVLDIGHAEIKALLGYCPAKSQTDKSFIHFETRSLPIAGISKRGVHDPQACAKTIERLVRQTSGTMGKEIDAAHILFSTAKQKFILKKCSFDADKRPSGIVLRDSWLQDKKDKVARELVKTHPHYKCTHIEPTAIVADSQDILYDYEDYHALSSVQISFFCTMTPNVFIEALQEAVEYSVNIASFTPAIALLGRLLTEKQKEDGAIILDIGAALTNMALYRNGTLQGTATLDFGGNVVTNTLALSKKISVEEAEQLKHDFTQGDAIIEASHQRTIEKEIAKWVKEKLLPIIEEHDTGKRFASGIILTGGGTLYTPVADVISKTTGLYASFVEPGKKISSPQQFALALAHLEAIGKEGAEATRHSRHTDSSLWESALNALKGLFP